MNYDLPVSIGVELCLVTGALGAIEFVQFSSGGASASSLVKVALRTCLTLNVLAWSITIGSNLRSMIVHMVRLDYLEEFHETTQAWRNRLASLVVGGGLALAALPSLSLIIRSLAAACLAINSYFVISTVAAVRSTALNARRPVQGPHDTKLWWNQARFGLELCLAWTASPLLLSLVLSTKGYHQFGQGVFSLLFLVFFPRPTRR